MLVLVHIPLVVPELAPLEEDSVPGVSRAGVGISGGDLVYEVGEFDEPRLALLSGGPAERAVVVAAEREYVPLRTQDEGVDSSDGYFADSDSILFEEE